MEKKKNILEVVAKTLGIGAGIGATMIVSAAIAKLGIPKTNIVKGALVTLGAFGLEGAAASMAQDSTESTVKEVTQAIADHVSVEVSAEETPEEVE